MSKSHISAVKLISRKICTVEKWKILSHQKNISWNQLFSNFFSKTIGFTKFLSKKCDREFSSFHTVQCITYWNLLSHFSCKNYVKLTWKLASRNISQVRVNFSFFHTVSMISPISTSIDQFQLSFWISLDLLQDFINNHLGQCIKFRVGFQTVSTSWRTSIHVLGFQVCS